MSDVQRPPAMGQEVSDQMVFVRGQTLQHIFEIDVRIVPVEPSALNRAHDRSCTPHMPTQAPSVERGSARPARAKMPSCRYRALTY